MIRKALLGVIWVAAWSCAGLVRGEQHVFLIGGGDEVTNSQVQIEANTRWVREVLETLPGQRRLHLYFSDGDDPAPDVTEWRRPPDDPGSLQPLARVFNAYWSNGEHYRNHRLGRVAGPTDRAFLAGALRHSFRQLSPGDRVLLVFNGHGAAEEESGSQHRMLLWNSTHMEVSDLEAVLAALPDAVRFRFVLTQCFSGGFARLARPGSNRCGFMAEAADQPAEGCSAAIDQQDFQDYSSYFFAALAGRDRFGSALTREPDRDGDGRVTPLEAHYHTLLWARSSDLPRATSEVFLLEWKPWYLEILLPWVETSGSPYHQMALELAQELGLDGGESLPSRLEGRRSQAEGEFIELTRQLEAVRNNIDQLRRPLHHEVLRRWPEAGYSYTRNFQRFLTQQLDAAQALILAHPDYPELVRSQELYWEIDDRLLEAERRVTDFERVAHLLELARRHRLLETRGDDQARARYAWLLDCESEPL